MRRDDPQPDSTRWLQPGVADPDRSVLMGGSYGGFMAAWLPTVDGRFKAP